MSTDRPTSKLVLERDVEGTFTKCCKKYRLIEIKLNVKGRRGWPDRLVIKKGKPACFMLVELKRPRGTLRKLQVHIHKVLRGCGIDVRVASTKAEAEAVVQGFAVP